MRKLTNYTLEEYISIAIGFKSPGEWQRLDGTSYESAGAKNDGTLPACILAQRKIWADKWEGVGCWRYYTIYDFIAIAKDYSNPKDWLTTTEPAHKGSYRAAMRRMDGTLALCIEAQRIKYGNQWTGRGYWVSTTCDEFKSIAESYSKPLAWRNTEIPEHKGSYKAAFDRHDGTYEICIEAQRIKWGDKWTGTKYWAERSDEELKTIACKYKSRNEWVTTTVPSDKGSYWIAKDRGVHKMHEFMLAQKNRWGEEWEGSKNWNAHTKEDFIKIAKQYKSPTSWIDASIHEHKGSWAASFNRKDGTYEACIAAQKFHWGKEWGGGLSGFRPDKPGYFYLLANSNYIKIGISNQPLKRTKTLNKEHTSETIFISLSFNGDLIYKGEKLWKKTLNMGATSINSKLSGYTETLDHDQLAKWISLAKTYLLLSDDNEKAIRIEYYRLFEDKYFEIFPDNLIKS